MFEGLDIEDANYNLPECDIFCQCELKLLDILQKYQYLHTFCMTKDLVHPLRLEKQEGSVQIHSEYCNAQLTYPPFSLNATCGVTDILSMLHCRR